MKRHEYWKSASDAFRDGRVDEDTYDAMIMNMDYFCDDDEEDEEEEELWNDLVEEMNEDEL